MCPDVVYSVHSLKKFFNHISDSNEKRQLLNSFVVSSNYEIKELCSFCQCFPIRVVKKIVLQQIKSSLTLREHLDLFNLSNDCEVGLDVTGQYRMNQLLSRQRKSTPNHSPFYINKMTGYIHYDQHHDQYNDTNDPYSISSHTMPVLRL